MDISPVVGDLDQGLRQLFETVNYKTVTKSCCGLVHIYYATSPNVTLSLKYQKGQIILDLFHVKDRIKLTRATFYKEVNKLFEFINLYLG